MKRGARSSTMIIPSEVGPKARSNASNGTVPENGVS